MVLDQGGEKIWTNVVTAKLLLPSFYSLLWSSFRLLVPLRRDSSGVVKQSIEDKGRAFNRWTCCSTLMYASAWQFCLKNTIRFNSWARKFSSGCILTAVFGSKNVSLFTEGSSYSASHAFSEFSLKNLPYVPGMTIIVKSIMELLNDKRHAYKRLIVLMSSHNSFTAFGGCSWCYWA